MFVEERMVCPDERRYQNDEISSHVQHFKLSRYRLLSDIVCLGVHHYYFLYLLRIRKNHVEMLIICLHKQYENSATRSLPRTSRS